MALISQSSFWFFLLRLAGLTGLFLALAGLALWRAIGIEAGLIVLLVGAGLVGIGLLGEIPVLLGSWLSRRGAAGGSVVVQIALASLLLAGVNYFSFFHYQRLDWTRDRIFTLKKELRDQLAKLRGETTIVVYQRHTAFGQTADNRQDNYDAAAQRKIVEKVKDLAELFQDFGPRFHVQLLDIQDDEFENKLADNKKEKPLLGQAIDKAPDNSIFFYAKEDDKNKKVEEKKERVQRLSFHDLYQLDKDASQKANGNKGNLVLHSQGIDAFARKILNIEEKRPRVGFGVVHEFMGVEGAEQIGMSGVKKALEARGYDCRDIILKQSMEDPAVLTHDEHKYERLEIQLAMLERTLKDIEDKTARFTREKGEFEKLPLAELEKKYVIVMSGPFGDVPYAIPPKELEAGDRYLRITNEDVRAFYLQDLKETLDKYASRDSKVREARDKANREKQELVVDNLEEMRRITDLRAKFKRTLADCDVLVLPRQTIFDPALKWAWPYDWFKLDQAQVEAIKEDFLKKGKPVMFCLGPPNDPRRLGAAGNDEIDNLLTSLGIELPAQTILFQVEAESLESSQQRIKLARPPEVPPLETDKPRAHGGLAHSGAGTKTGFHPIRESLGLSAHGFSKNYPSDLKIRAPRPVYAMTISPEANAGALALVSNPGGMGSFQAATLLAAKFRKVDDRAVLLFTSADSWNDDQPFPSEDRVPRLERGKDPNRGTILEKREGPFPVAVALETRLPQSWYDESSKTEPAKVRLVVLGHGGLFMGETLTPMKEKLLLDTTNWLLGRDDLLARANAQPWQFPRVQMADNSKNLWTWGAALGLPLLFVYLGTVMWLVRRMR